MRLMSLLTSSMVIAAFWLLSGVDTADARVIFKEKTRYYNVSGSTGAEIYRSMEANGPIHGGSNKEILASTSFTFSVENVKSGIVGNNCVLRSLDIVVGVTYTYPRWRGSKRASRETRRAWRNFQKLAVLHEKGHVKITRKFAKDYEKVLLKSKRRASGDCQRKSLGEIFRTNIAVRRHERLQRAFDRKDLRPGGRAYDSLKALILAR